MRVLAFTAAASLIVGIFAGLLPAWRASHPNIAGSLNESARGSSEGAHGRRLRSALVVVEIVLALLLLSTAGLLVESFLRLQKVPPGFDRTNVFTARVALPDATYGKPAECAAFFDKLLKRVGQSPGVQSASAAWWIPLSGSEITLTTDIQEHPLPKSEQPAVQVNVVAPEFFKTLRVPLLRGRDFTERDDINAPAVAIVTQSFVNKYFRGENALGKRIKPSGSVTPGEPPMREIVGVVGDLHLTTLREAAQPQIYIPHQQFAISTVSLFVRSTVNPSSLTSSLRNAVAELDKDVPLYRPRLLSEYVSSSIAQPRFNAILVALFAGIALLLAAAGIFGVMSYAVSQRTHEIGIRLALGAQRGDVLRLIFGEGMRLVALGAVVGIALVFAVGRLLSNLLYGIGASDPVTIFSVTILLGFVAFIACWWPARRASGVDPVVALRASSPMHAILQDFRYALRMLAKQPAFAAIAVLTLALGIGANTAIFSVVNAVLLRPLPYPHSEQLILLRERFTGPNGFESGSVSYLNYLDWRAGQRSFTDLALVRPEGVNLSAADVALPPERVRAARVTANYFSILRGRATARARFH